MSNRLKGFLRLSAIPKELIQTTKSGTKGVYISISELREKGKFGDTHTMTIWDKDAKKAIYICDLKPDGWEDRKPTENSQPQVQQDDLPF